MDGSKEFSTKVCYMLIHTTNSAVLHDPHSTENSFDPPTHHTIKYDSKNLILLLVELNSSVPK